MRVCVPLSRSLSVLWWNARAAKPKAMRSDSLCVRTKVWRLCLCGKLRDADLPRRLVLLSSAEFSS